jgi:hypothetical protein
MSVVYNVNVRNARLQQVVNAIDAGPGNGRLQIGTPNMAVVLSTVILNKPSGTIAGGILTFSNTPLVDPLAANTGLAASGQVTDSTGTVVISGLSVGTSSAFDIQISLPNISAGSIVTFTSGTITGN